MTGLGCCFLSFRFPSLLISTVTHFLPPEVRFFMTRSKRNHLSSEKNRQIQRLEEQWRVVVAIFKELQGTRTPSRAQYLALLCKHSSPLIEQALREVEERNVLLLPADLYVAGLFEKLATAPYIAGDVSGFFIWVERVVQEHFLEHSKIRISEEQDTSCPHSLQVFQHRFNKLSYEQRYLIVQHALHARPLIELAEALEQSVQEIEATIRFAWAILIPENDAFELPANWELPSFVNKPQN